MVGKFYEQNKHVITELGQSVRERWVNNSEHPGKEELILLYGMLYTYSYKLYCLSNYFKYLRGQVSHSE